MKKLIILVVLAITLTGCTVVRIDTKNIENIVSVILSKDNNLYNRVGRGYKYYVPRGVTHIDTNDLNEKLYSEGNYYYLYIDAISYFHQKKLDYKINEDAYYSQKIEANGKEGYLEINKIDDLYFIEFMYNFAKIEAMLPFDSINRAVLKSSYILSTIDFNQEVVKIMLDDNYFTSREEVYDIFSAQEKIDSSEIKQWLEYGEKKKNRRDKMGLFDKLKDIFSDENDDEPVVKSQMVQVEIGDKNGDVEHDRIIDNAALKKDEVKETKIYFDDKDFDTLSAPKKEKRTYGFKEIKKEAKKEFKASPVISPVYGILDKNYHKEDIQNKPKTKEYVERFGDKVTIDQIRKKAYGTLEDDIEKDLFKSDAFLIEDSEPTMENDLFDELDFNLDGVLDEEVSEEEKEVELDYIVNVAKEKPLLDDLKEEELNEQEADEEPEEEAEEEKDDLFNLIDSMYEKEGDL